MASKGNVGQEMKDAELKVQLRVEKYNLIFNPYNMTYTKDGRDWYSAYAIGYMSDEWCEELFGD